MKSEQRLTENRLNIQNTYRQKSWKQNIMQNKYNPQLKHNPDVTTLNLVKIFI